MAHLDPMGGRPKLDPAHAKTRRLEIRLTDSTHERWERAYREDGAATLSDWLRDLGDKRADAIERRAKKKRDE